MFNYIYSTHERNISIVNIRYTLYFIYSALRYNAKNNVLILLHRTSLWTVDALPIFKMLFVSAAYKAYTML